MRKTILVIAIAIILAAGVFYAFPQKPSRSAYAPIPVPDQGMSGNNPGQDANLPKNQNMPQDPLQSNSFVLSTASNPSLGTYLVGENGMTLYKFASDTPGVSNCTGQCAVIWPPYAVSPSDAFKVNSGVAGTVAKITRPDGTMQVTYNGSPLYFYSQDKKAGDTNGQNFGGVWSVVNP
ncbi:MAG: hypothetical protein WC831_02955 [Parcubacteria group bacterium]|jgi:predicted lipoprotein with Yx(FWY)xxD motif